VTVSHAVEDYLKAIYELQIEQGKVSTNALADTLKVAPASVTGMLKKLAEDRPRLINYERHHGVSLTPAGEKIALEVIRHHRLIELYLHQALGYPLDQVDAEAEKLEHVISEDFEDRIAKWLGNPELDPHGDPIPSKDGKIAPTIGSRLSQIDVGQKARVIRLRDDDPALLRYLAGLGVVLEATLTVVEKAPFGGPIHIRVGSATHALGKQVTDQVFVEVE
jgi:DtxR family Mn-dependent transcriptional regulator